MLATDGTLRFATIERECRRLATPFVLVSTCFALTIGVFLIARRLAGAFVAPLPATQLLATALLFATWAIVAREFMSRSRFNTSLLVGVLLLFACACSYPGDRVVDWLIWAGALAAIVWSPTWRRQPSAKLPRHNSTSLAEIDSENDSEQLLQQFTRCRRVDGSEAIHGTLVAEFAPDQRQATAYVAFCPPFERLPEVEVEVAGDAAATVKTVQVLHNGAQFEIKLAAPSDGTTSVALELAAFESAESAAASD